jgi:transcriptional regulator of arginine metabolism
VSRAAREQAIREIIAAQAVATQAGLVAALAARGFAVTQGTVSRDIQDLRLVKLPTPEGGHRYAAPEAVAAGASPPLDTALREASQAVVAVGEGGALLVVRTLAGRANMVALAIDQARLPGVVGTVAGDDTVLVVLADEVARDGVRRMLVAAGVV